MAAVTSRENALSATSKNLVWKTCKTMYRYTGIYSLVLLAKSSVALPCYCLLSSRNCNLNNHLFRLSIRSLLNTHTISFQKLEFQHFPENVNGS